ncbi:prephenate dehydratase [Jiulongibacter sediminis]|uniref:Bifunctional chorismate mutase/prephenate dehydratase n=1 Tax=Jiulongibacter sediminis TaxID=1605367 RepID=A0A0P7BRC9_9BACT|nr:prephenate dehydratase [Jiulongibacter sediminis]KPM49833.1 chloride transporter [Jiulongibacter sediminis]TBX26869.1 chloride transporter [Jiulongibacter sediminis]
MNLDDLRKGIDSIDSQLLELLNQRMELVKQVGDLKRETKTVIYRPEREKEIVSRLAAESKGALDQKAIEAIFLEIFATARNIELPEKVAYMGPEGSFTHQAAESRFGALSEYIMLPSIQAVFESVDTERARFGVIPIENNQAGIVYETVDLLNEMDVSIVAELKIPIHFALASVANHLTDIKRIYSKDIAFRQCRSFLNKYFEQQGIEEIQVESTSKAAKMAFNDPESAAICSEIAAKLFGLPMVFQNIEDSSNNRTRFFILAKNFENQPSGNDKTTMIARLPHTENPGVLADFLTDFKEQEINISKIESRPYKGSQEFNFWFFLEVGGYYKDEKLSKIIEKHQDHIKVLGSYVRNI